MNDALRRALRTFLQGAIAVLMIVAVPALNTMVSDVVAGRDIIVDLNIWKSIAFAAIAGGLAALISWVQNAVEEKTGKAIVPK